MIAGTTSLAVKQQIQERRNLGNLDGKLIRETLLVFQNNLAPVALKLMQNVCITEEKLYPRP